MGQPADIMGHNSNNFGIDVDNDVGGNEISIMCEEERTTTTKKDATSKKKPKRKKWKRLIAPQRVADKIFNRSNIQQSLSHENMTEGGGGSVEKELKEKKYRWKKTLFASSKQ